MIERTTQGIDTPRIDVRSQRDRISSELRKLSQWKPETAYVVGDSGNKEDDAD
jgi:hypothetical protein